MKKYAPKFLCFSKKAFVFLFSLCACAFSFADAPTATAVWDGEFKSPFAKGGYTLYLNNNVALNDGTLQFVSTTPTRFEGTNSELNTGTFILKLSDLDLTKTEKTFILGSIQNDNTQGAVGFAIGSDRTVLGGKNNVQVENTVTGDDACISEGTGDKTLAVIMNKNGDLKVYEILSNDNARTLVKRHESNGGCNNINFKGIALGAWKNQDVFKTNTDLKLKSLAIFKNTELTEEQIKEYEFPYSKVDVVCTESSLTATKINELMNDKGAMRLTLPQETTINLDTNLAGNVQFVSDKNLTFTKDDSDAIEESELNKINLDNVYGSVIANWLDEETKSPSSIGFNFRSTNGSETTNALETGGIWKNDNGNEANGSDRAILSNGLTKISWSSKNTWYYETGSILNGYLDDGDSGARIFVSGIPYEFYDVIIYCGSDDSNSDAKLTPKVVNGVSYTMTGEAAVPGTAIWGETKTTEISYEKSAMRVKRLSGSLSILGGVKSGNNRGSISAIQIVKNTSVLRLNITSNTTFSALKEFFTNGVEKVICNFEPNLKITLDNTTFEKSLAINCGGDISLVKESMPEQNEFTNIDFSGVEGKIIREYTYSEATNTAQVVGINFNSKKGKNVALALENGRWVDITDESASGETKEVFAEGFSVASWTCRGVYSRASGDESSHFINGYLDEGTDTSVKINVTNIPYTNYDVIVYYSTDNNSRQFNAPNINGTFYTWDDASAQATNATSALAKWGSSAFEAPIYGKNALRINNLTGDLAIDAGDNKQSANNSRGSVAAIQIMPTGTDTVPELQLGAVGTTTNINWSAIEDSAWVKNKPVNTNQMANIKIKLLGDVDLTFDTAVSIGTGIIDGEGFLLKMINKENLTISGVSGSATLALNEPQPSWSNKQRIISKVASLASQEGGITFCAGAGEENSAVTFALNGGSATLEGNALETAPYYIKDSQWTATQTSVIYTNAVVKYEQDSTTETGKKGRFGIGQADYVLAGSTVVTTPLLCLSQGGNNRTSRLTIKDSASLTVSEAVNADKNSSSIMFGHWNGPTFFTIKDNATFTAPNSDVLIGKTSNTQTIRIEGGRMEVKGLKSSDSASADDTLTLTGGTLSLGATGISTYGSNRLAVTVDGSPTIETRVASLTLPDNMTMTSSSTLTLTKTNVNEATVVCNASLTTGKIAVGENVTLDLGAVSRPQKLSIEPTGKLKLRLSNGSDAPTFVVESETKLTSENTTLYVGDSVTPVVAKFTTGENNAITVSVGEIVFTASEGASFVDATKWSDGATHTSGDITISLLGDATITLFEEVPSPEFDTVKIQGSGTLSFVFGANENKKPCNLLATNIEIADGATLAFYDYSYSTDQTSSSNFVAEAVISGAGAVATYGPIQFTKANTFTGGLKVMAQEPGRASDATFGNGDIIVYPEGAFLYNLLSENASVVLAGGKLRSSSDESTKPVLKKLSLSAKSKIEALGEIIIGGAESLIDLQGYELVKIGDGALKLKALANATTGDISIKEGTIEVVEASSLGAARVGVFSGAEIKLSAALSAINELALHGGNQAIKFSGCNNLPASFNPIITAACFEKPNTGSEFVFVTSSDNSLMSVTFTENVGGRFVTPLTKTASEIKGTIKALSNWWHYDFNKGVASKDDAKAPDSAGAVGGWSEVSSGAESVRSASKKAVKLLNSTTDDKQFQPYWNNNSYGKSPLYARALTITTVVKSTENASYNRVIWGLGSKTSSPKKGIALVEDGANAFAVVEWDDTKPLKKLARVDNIPNFTTQYHFVAIVLEPNGTRLIVDKQEVSTENVCREIGKEGQLGSIHGEMLEGYANNGSNGCLLDDWQVFDARLTDAELGTVRETVRPRAVQIILR